MFCPNCGNEIDPGSKFCGNCGYRIEQPQPPKKKKKGLIIALSIIGALLLMLIILVAAAFILLKRIHTGNNVDDYGPGEIEHIMEEKEAELKEALQEATEEIEGIQELIEVPAENEDILMKDAQAAAAYLDVVREHKDRIRGYIWQDDFAENGWDDSGISISENRPVILADIGGDEAKELILLEAVDDGSASLYAANMHVFAYDGEKAVDLSETLLDAQAGGGTYYALFSGKDDKALYLFRSWGDENWTDSFIRYEVTDGGLLETYDLSMRSEPDENYEEVLWKYSENGAEITEEEYAAKKTALIDSIGTVYCWNTIADEELAAKINESSAAAFTYSEAVDELKAEAGDLAADEAEDELLTDEEAEMWLGALGSPSRTFMFSSGAGGWWTELTLRSDGTFEGNYQDSDMGDDRAPNGVQYVCHFAGRFSALTKIDDYKYSMTIEELATEENVGDEWEEEGILYIASEPYGLDGGETFYLYLPGQSTSELPEEFVQWIRMPMGYPEAPEYMTFYGIFNEKAECGFFSTEG